MKDYLIFDNRAADADAHADSLAGVLNFDGNYDVSNWQYIEQLNALSHDGVIGSDTPIDTATSKSKDSQNPAPSDGKTAVSFGDTLEPEPDEDEPLIVNGRTHGGSGFLTSSMFGGSFGRGYGDLSFGSISAETSTPGVTITEVLVVNAVRPAPARGPAVIPPAYNLDWLFRNYDNTNPNDQDGNGIPDELDVLVVTARGTSRDAAIANHFATQFVNERFIITGAAFGLVGLDLTAALRILGWSAGQSTAVIGGLTALGIPTSISELLPEMRQPMIDAVTMSLIQYIHDNPDEFFSWMKNPFTGEYFDANDRSHNQND